MALWLESTIDNSFAVGSATTYSNALDYSNTSVVDVLKPDNLQKVARWNDINPRIVAGLKKSAAQHLLARQPQYLSNGINGLPALWFNSRSGAGVCMMSLVDIDRTVMPKLSIFVVYRRNNVNTGTTQKLFGADNGGWDRQVLFENFNGVSDGAWVAAIPNLSNYDKNQIFSYISNVGVANGSKAYINGGSAVNFQDGNFSGESHPAITIPGNNNQSYRRDLDANCVDFANLIIGEFIVFERNLSNEEVLLVEKYLAKKWSIALK